MDETIRELQRRARTLPGDGNAVGRLLEALERADRQREMFLEACRLARAGSPRAAEVRDGWLRWSGDGIPGGSERSLRSARINLASLVPDEVDDSFRLARASASRLLASRRNADAVAVLDPVALTVLWARTLDAETRVLGLCGDDVVVRNADALALLDGGDGSILARGTLGDDVVGIGGEISKIRLIGDRAIVVVEGGEPVPGARRLEAALPSWATTKARATDRPHGRVACVEIGDRIGKLVWAWELEQFRPWRHPRAVVTGDRILVDHGSAHLTALDLGDGSPCYHRDILGLELERRDPWRKYQLEVEWRRPDGVGDAREDELVSELPLLGGPDPCDVVPEATDFDRPRVILGRDDAIRWRIPITPSGDLSLARDCLYRADVELDRVIVEARELDTGAVRFRERIALPEVPGGCRVMMIPSEGGLLVVVQAWPSSNHPSNHPDPLRGLLIRIEA